MAAPHSDGDDLESLPDELPLSPLGDAPLAGNATPDEGGAPHVALGEHLGVVVAGAPLAQGRAPDEQEGSARTTVAAARLVPIGPSGQGRGRGRGRPRKVGPALVDARVVGELARFAAGSGLNPAGAQPPAVPNVLPLVDAQLQCWLGEPMPRDALEKLATIPHVTADTRPRALSLGYAEPFAEDEAVVAALCSSMVDRSSHVDADVEEMLELMLSGAGPSIIPISAMSVLTNVHRKKVPVLVPRSAAVAYMLGLARADRLQKAIVAIFPRKDLLHYIEAVQYDETDLPVRIKGDPKDTSAIGVAEARPGAQRGALTDTLSNALVASSGMKSLGAHASKAPQKVMQTRLETGAVLRLGAWLVTLTFHTPCPLAVMESSSAACILRQQLLFSPARRASSAFNRITRAATTDALAANRACERSIMPTRGVAHHGHSLHLLCGVHATALVYSKSFAPLDPEMSGAIRLALSLRTGGGMTRFRKCLREEVASRLDVLHGRAPPSALAHKRALLRRVVAHGCAVETRQALLVLCPNGDWRKANVEYYVLPGSPLTDPGAILEHVTNGLVIALASSQPHVYNRSKWTGSDIAVDQLGVFEACHRLLSTTYARFCASFASGSLAAQYLMSGRAMRDYTHQSQVEVANALGLDAEVSEEVEAGEQPGPSEPPAPLAVGDLGSGDAKSDQWAAENAANRKKGFAFIRPGCLGSLVLIRLAMEPLRQYLGKQFERASDAWEFKERAQLAEALKAGEQRKRRFRVVEVAQGADDEQFMQSLRLLFDCKNLWSPMPQVSQTVTMRALAFRTLSRQCCAFNKLLKSRRQKFPFQTFRLLADPGLAAGFRDAPECSLDRWTKSVREAWPSLEGPELQQTLYSIAILLRVDISHIESRHASVRRFLTAGSVQTHAMAMPFLSALWTFQQHRTSHTYHGSRFGVRQKTHKRPGTRAKAKAKASARRKTNAGDRVQRRGFGGAWRAWVRRYCNGPFRQWDLAAESRRYQAAKRARAPEYLEAERVGKEAAQLGRRTSRHGFGGQASQIRRSMFALRKMHEHLSLGYGSQDAANRTIAVVARSVAAGCTISESLSAARYGKRVAAAHSRVAEEKLHMSLAEYEGNAGGAIVQAVRQACPELQGLPLAAVPSTVGHHVRVELPSEQELAGCVSWASQHAHSSGLAVRLEKQWESLHVPIGASDAPSVSQADDADAESPCWKAGLCLCSDSGQRLHRRVVRFLNYMKAIARARVGFRDDLRGGFLAVRLVGMKTDYESLISDGDGLVERWYHIGLHYLSPYEPSFMAVEEVADPLEVDANPKRVYVRSLHQYHEVWQGLEPFRESDTIAAKWYRVEESERPIGGFCPCPTPLLRMSGFESAQQWWPRRLGSARAPRAANPDADGDEGSDEVESLDEGDDAGEDLAPAPEDEGPAPAFEGLLDAIRGAYDQPLDMVLFDADVAPSDGPGEGDPPSADPPPIAGDSGAAPPPPEPLANAPRRRKRKSMENTVAFGGGLITYYDSNGNFEAHCLVHEAERCTLTRAGFRVDAAGSSRDAVPRPLGLLAAWLQTAEHFGDKAGHKAPDRLAHLSGAEGYELRLEQRRALAAVAGSEMLFENERPRRDGEGEEPQDAKRG